MLSRMESFKFVVLTHLIMSLMSFVPLGSNAVVNSPALNGESDVVVSQSMAVDLTG